MSFALAIPVLETERLNLRGFREADLDRFAEFCACEVLTRFVGGPSDRGGTWRRIAIYIGHWALEEKVGGRFVGYSGLWNPEGSPEPELIWGLTGDAHGRGYATEAARRVREFAYGKPRLAHGCQLHFAAESALAAGSAAARRHARG